MAISEAENALGQEVERLNELLDEELVENGRLRAKVLDLEAENRRYKELVRSIDSWSHDRAMDEVSGHWPRRHPVTEERGG